MRTSDFDYYLTPELIAQTPVEPRDRSRLMVIKRQNGYIEHHHFSEMGDFLTPGDVLVFNDTRVIPARLYGVKAKGQLELNQSKRTETPFMKDTSHEKKPCTQNDVNEMDEEYKMPARRECAKGRSPFDTAIPLPSRKGEKGDGHCILESEKSANTGSDKGAKIEFLLLKRIKYGVWEAIARPAKRLSVGARVNILDITNRQETDWQIEILEKKEGGLLTISIGDEELLEKGGQIPLPPYVHTELKDTGRYQTVYARIKGSVAAPTAGLHFTPVLINSLIKKGVEVLFVTLHIGLDTFQPVRVEDPLQHQIHREYGEICVETAQAINKAMAERRRIVCVGTSTSRLLEFGAYHSQNQPATANNIIKPYAGMVDLFILPGYRFKIIDVLITNFHLPRSTLLMLVSAFAGADLIRKAYDEAIREKYRFYSFGDAMMIL